MGRHNCAENGFDSFLMSQLGKLLSASLAITVFVLRISRKVLLLKF